MSITTEEPVGTLQTALAHTARLLETDPVMAERQAREILKVVPDDRKARLFLASARRLRGDAIGASEILDDLLRRNGDDGSARRERGLARAAQGRHRDAVEDLRGATTLDPRDGRAWQALGDQLTLLDDTDGADAAYGEAIRASVDDPRLMEAALALCEGRLAVGEQILRTHLKARPTDVAAIRMLAEIGARLGRYEDAEMLLSRCMELAPGFTAARHNLAIVLHRQSKAPEALAEIDRLLAVEPGNPSYRFLKAAVLARIGEYDGAIEIYEEILKEYPESARGWLSCGHALKTAGRTAESIAAYLSSIESAPHFGEAYWSLANMKTYKFDDATVARMQGFVERSDLDDADRLHFHFALGKALEDRGAYEHSFAHYEQGAFIRRATNTYDADETTRLVERSRALLTPAFFEARKGVGAAAADPIFIVGLPRAGSTLLEQILASHSAVEGTMELPDILMLARRLGGGKTRGVRYPEVLADLSPEDLRALGAEYIARTRVQRKAGTPFFIDKMPNNFQHIGLIQLILPNAKIIDARRHPLGCCFSAFKQQFARGQGFSYDLTDVGRYYADYVALMAHFDHALPGRVHRVIYESIVAEPEREIRRLLAFCGLPFEEACLSFHQNTRAVRTASSEQVRQPIYTDATDHWRHYEPWLGPLKAALGPALEGYAATAEHV